MKNLAYLLLGAGFLAGAFATSTDVRAVNWTLFVVAAVIAVVGLVILKRQSNAAARSAETLASNRAELDASITNIVADLETATADAGRRGDALRDWIDDTLRPDLRRFADARESMVHLFGLQTYADIMSNFAAGERYVNRVWSASADGYDDEARASLGKAAGLFSAAKSQLAAASRGKIAEQDQG